MPRSKEFLLEQIARARRFAAAMNADADRERFEKLAAEYRSELDAAEAAAAAPDASSQDAVQTNEAAMAQPETADSNATPPAANGGDDQGPTTD
jgi:predicted phage gp36 major capsid-like protein